MKQHKTTVTIFISSTFRDMHTERDYLVKNIFPRLREWCRLKKGISLVEVDLRWGVTEDDVKNVEVIHICLEEIERSRPFFIGLIGDRYGWIPREFNVPDGPINDWLKSQDSQYSITALEITKGVLEHPEMQHMAHFYFRDNSFSAYVPAEKQQDILPENPEALQRLIDLKKRIRSLYQDMPENIKEYYPKYGGLKIDWLLVRKKLSQKTDKALLEKLNHFTEDNLIDPNEWNQLTQDEKELILPYTVVYLDETSLKDFGEHIYNDLKKSIDEMYDDRPEVVDTLAVERQFQNDFILEKTRLFIGRNQELREIMEILLSKASNSGTALLLTGTSGVGKSALAAKIALQWNLENTGIPIFSYFLGTTSAVIDLHSFLQFLYKEICKSFNIPLKTLPESLFKRSKFIADFLSDLDNPCFILIDALDQLNDSMTALKLEWLPRILPTNIKILITTLPGSVLKTAELKGFRIIDILPLNLLEKEILVKEYLKQYRKQLGYDSKAGIDQMELLLSRRDADLPLYLTTAAEELRFFPYFELLTERIRLFPDSVSELFEQIMENLEVDFNKELIQSTFGLLSVSRMGLTEEELLELLATPEENILPHAIWSKLFLRIKNYLRGVYSSGSLLSFYHREMLEAARKRYTSSKEQVFQYHEKLGRYFIRKALGNNPQEPWQSGYERGFSEGIFHLSQAKLWEEVEKVYKDFHYTIACLKQGWLDHYLRQNLELAQNISPKDNEFLYTWSRFVNSNAHILRRADKEWPSYKIMLQLAVEHGDDSPVTRTAEDWLDRGYCNWTWLRIKNRPKHYYQDSCITVMEGHTGSVKGAIIRDDGTILSWSDDGNLRLWTSGGQPLKTMKGHSAPILGVIIRDDNYIVSWSEDNNLGLWNFNGDNIKMMKGHQDTINGAMFINDGMLISWSNDGTIRLWNRQGDQVKVLKDMNKPIEGLRICQNGNIISWYSYDHLSETDFNANIINIWNSQGILQKKLDQHKGPVYNVITIDQDRILSCGADSSLILWDSNKGTILKIFQGHTDAVLGAEVTDEGKIISWSEDDTIRIWDVNSNKIIIIKNPSGTCDGISILNNNYFISWNDRETNLWNFRGQLIKRMPGHMNETTPPLINEDNDIFILDKDTIHIFYKSGKHKSLKGHHDIITGAILNKNRILLSWSMDGTLRLWRTEYDESYYDDSGKESLKGNLVLDEKHLLIWQKGQKLQIINRDTGMVETILSGHTAQVCGAIVTGDNKIISWGDDKTIRFWSIKGNEEKKIKQTTAINGILLVEDGTILTWGSDNIIRLWDRKGKLITEFTKHKETINGAIQLDEKYFLSYGNEGIIRIWNRKGKEEYHFKAHSNPINQVRIDSDGNVITWSRNTYLPWDDGNDFSIRIWDLKGHLLKTLEGPHINVKDILILRNGGLISWYGESFLEFNHLYLWNSTGELKAVLKNHHTGIQGAIELYDNSILTWSRTELIHWDNQGNLIEIITLPEGLARFSEFKNAYLKSGRLGNNYFSIGNNFSAKLFIIKEFTPHLLSSWECRYHKVMQTSLFSKGTLWVSTEEQTYELQLYQGKHIISLNEHGIEMPL